MFGILNVFVPVGNDVSCEMIADGVKKYHEHEDVRGSICIRLFEYHDAEEVRGFKEGRNRIITNPDIISLGRHCTDIAAYRDRIKEYFKNTHATIVDVNPSHNTDVDRIGNTAFRWETVQTAVIQSIDDQLVKWVGMFNDDAKINRPKLSKNIVHVRDVLVVVGPILPAEQPQSADATPIGVLADPSEDTTDASTPDTAPEVAPQTAPQTAPQIPVSQIPVSQIPDNSAEKIPENFNWGQHRPGHNGVYPCRCKLCGF